jgi:GT2 family glycosyltransferase
MAVFNRREMTMKILQQLDELSNDEIEIGVTICDDGSTDGTSALVRKLHPNVTIIETSGDNYWAKSMAIADIESFNLDYDYLVWLNDDTFLNADCFESVISDYRTLLRNDCILVGALCDPQSGQRSYSGCVHFKIGRQDYLEFINPLGLPVKIGMFSGNFVVIPKSVRALVGSINSKFTHGWADMHYGFQAKKLGELTSPELVFLVSTSRGILSSQDAEFFGLGGEMVCKIQKRV